MADNDLTEFDFIDPLELHLVGTPANQFAPLMAKSTEKGKKMNKKDEKALRKLQKGIRGQSYPSISSPRTTGVNLAGPGSSTIGNKIPATKVVAAVLAGLEQRVRKARAEVDGAQDPLTAMRAKSNLGAALRQRLSGKMVLAENARHQGHAQSPLGPGADQLFKAGSTHTIGDDSSLQYR